MESVYRNVLTCLSVYARTKQVNFFNIMMNNGVGDFRL